MPELFLTIFFISILLLFLGSGVWVAISMIGVSSIGMLFLPLDLLAMQWQPQFGEQVHHGH